MFFWLAGCWTIWSCHSFHHDFLHLAIQLISNMGGFFRWKWGPSRTSSNRNVEVLAVVASTVVSLNVYLACSRHLAAMSTQIHRVKGWSMGDPGCESSTMQKLKACVITPRHKRFPWRDNGDTFDASNSLGQGGKKKTLPFFALEERQRPWILAPTMQAWSGGFKKWMMFGALT